MTERTFICRYARFAGSIFLLVQNRYMAYAIRYDINPSRAAAHIACAAHIERNAHIENPNGIYIAANKKLPSEEGSFIVSY